VRIQILDDEPVHRPAVEDDPGASEESVVLLSINLMGLKHVDVSSLLEDLETQLIRWAMKKAEGNLTKAAEMLGLPRSTLQYKIYRRSLSNKTNPSQN